MGTYENKERIIYPRRSEIRPTNQTSETTFLQFCYTDVKVGHRYGLRKKLNEAFKLHASRCISKTADVHKVTDKAVTERMKKNLELLITIKEYIYIHDTLAIL